MLFDGVEIPLDETFTSFDVPMDLITKKTGHVIKIYSTIAMDWTATAIADDTGPRFDVHWTRNGTWKKLEQSGQDKLTDTIYDAYFHDCLAANITYEWATDPDIPSQKALKVTLDWIHRDPSSSTYRGFSFDVLEGCLNYNYIVQRAGILTFRDPAPCNVRVGLAKDGS